MEANLHGTKSKTMIGKIVAHFRIIKEIGHGGMGIVYQAEDTKLKRTVALKFLPSELTQDAEAKQRFLHEARAAAAINHANIVTVHEINEHEGRVYIAMEYVEGRTLKELIAVNRPPSTVNRIPIPEVLDIAMQIASGLTAAHAKGIVHRDIKPANILVTNDDTVKILDFGIAKLAGSKTKLTKTGSTVGTVAYMSPEQAMGREVDPRTDIWSLGVILYEMLAGELPFRGDYEQAVVYSILNEEPEPLAKARPDMPAGLASIVGRALAKDTKERYQNINELAANLKAAVEGTLPIKARTQGLKANILSKKSFCLSAAATALAILFGLNVGGMRRSLLGPGAPSARAIRLAVLPFANLSSDPEQEYFSDGLTQEMIVRLGRLHPQSLSVIARTSVMRYKKGDAPIDQIGRELNIDYVLEGSARREGSRVKVTAELIQVKNQAQLWAETYEREMAGILALQNDVAGKVAGALALQLLPSEQAQLARGHTVDPEAYEAYLRGTHYRHTMTKEGLEAAERYFTLAMEKDPNYAAAWAGIAGVWTARQQMGITPPKEAFSKAKEAAHRSLELDPDECEALRVMAGILTWGDWNWRDADRAWKRVFAINPDYTPALSTYSHFLMVMGRQDEALASIERALELDPFDIKALSFHSLLLLFVRRYDEGLAAARKALKLQSDNPVARSALIGTLFMEGMFDELMAIERSRWAKDGNLLEALEQGYGEGGYPISQKRLADALAARYGKPGGVTAYTLANFYARAGQRDRVIEWLERAFDAGDGNMPYLGLPVFDLVRSDPRFQSLRNRIGLPAAGEK